MSDIRTRFISFDAGCDWLLDGASLAQDDGMETSIIHALFSDRRANDDDQLPFGQTDRRGWWGDSFPVVPGDRIGSRLWLLSRDKQTQATLNRAREYASEALQWLVADGIAERVDVEAAIVRSGVLGLDVAIQRPRDRALKYRFETLWSRT